jgi:PAS domain S-box-containing protein
MSSAQHNNRILVIDDNQAIHEDFRKILSPDKSEPTALDDAEALLFGDTAAKRVKVHFEIESAFQGQEGLEMVQRALAAGRPYAMAFVDVRMPPGWDGVETITRIWKVSPELQVVICTAYSDYSWDEISSSLGQADNMLILKKPFDNIEVLQLAHALTKKWTLTQQAKGRLEDLDRIVQERTAELRKANESLQQEITERRHVEEALRVSQERFSKAFQASPIPIAIRSLREERYVDVNESFLRTTGYQREEVIGRTPAELRIYVDPELQAKLTEQLQSGRPVRNLGTKLRGKSNDVRDIILSAELFTLGSEPHVLVIAQDISENVNLENQLRQAQKMEAVGQLAAGVAHDFNNLLTVIQGHASLRLSGPQAPAQLSDSLKQIISAADRASALTRQLLAFSRKQIMQPKPICLNELIDNVADMLRRLIGEHIDLQCQNEEGLPYTYADACNLEQVILNLAVNARDAMPKGGQLLLRTSRVQVDPSCLDRNAEARVGDFVCLTVTDTGCGMDDFTRKHIFEPFFTTKEVGKGTGMGLATAYGIIKQHNGWIEVESELDHGTVFRIYLPVTEQKPQTMTGKPETPDLRGGPETILMVEDEPLLRELVQCVLEQQGYRVLTATSGVEALKLWNESGGGADLLLTDMVMPGGMTGRELADRLRPLDADLRVIFTSGYSQDFMGRSFALGEGINFLPKPYHPPTLVEMVRNCLDDRRHSTTNPKHNS